MPPPIVMMIRHGEKPPSFGAGVTHHGAQDDYSLAVRGWTRAGALIAFFSHPRGSIVTPQIIYAAAPVEKGSSLHGRRPLQTVKQLADARGITLDASHAVGEEQKLAKAILNATVPVLVSWEHHALTDIVNPLLIPGFTTKYPDDRFDLVWLLTWSGSAYAFGEANQGLLPGDVPA